jgi:hypothetical protein
VPNRYRGAQPQAPLGEGPVQEAPKVPTPPQQSDSTIGAAIKWLLGTGVRVGTTSLGTAVGAGLGTMVAPGPGTAIGAALGGIVGGATGEAGAERYVEHQPISPGRMAVSGAIGAVPGSYLLRGGLAGGAAKNAVMGYAGVAGNKLVAGENTEKALNPLEWNGSELVAPLFGGIMGGVPRSLHRQTIGCITKTISTSLRN